MDVAGLRVHGLAAWSALHPLLPCGAALVFFAAPPMKTLHLILQTAFLAIGAMSVSAASSDGSVARDQQKGYDIQRGDEISVRVYVEHVPQDALGARAATVDARGEIRLGGIPESIQLVGQSLSAAADAIRNQYAKTGLTSLRITVLLRKDGKLIMAFSPRPDTRIAAER
jgi:protein involved in polysaccharide export with SLBB domain